MDTLAQGDGLKTLGSRTAIPATPTAETLETFLNSHPDRDYVIEHSSDQFASHCPVTGAPDFASYSIRYIADKKCVESKSLKLYANSWMTAPGAFMERIANEFLTALVKATSPRGAVVEMWFSSRGGIETAIRVDYLDPDLDEGHQDIVAMSLGIPMGLWG